VISYVLSGALLRFLFENRTPALRKRKEKPMGNATMLILAVVVLVLVEKKS